MADLDPQQKIALINENLQEVLRPDIIEDAIVKENRPLVIYWGTATTGKPHCGYFVPMIKIAQFLRAGCRVKILLADIHGFLDNLKAPIELVKFRAEYYKYAIKALLKAVGVSLDKLEFVLGSSYQLTAEYTMDLFRLSSVVTEHDAKKAGAEVVKQVENATLSGLIYPLMQSLDEQFLGVDAQFGGVDQRKIFTLATEVLPKIGYKERAHLMNPMVPGLAGGKMSSSDPDSKIDILDTADLVRKKIRKAYAAAQTLEGNGMISFVEYVLLPVSSLQSSDGSMRFEVEQREGGKEPIVYSDIDTLKEDYKADRLTPQLLKGAVTKGLVDILTPIQAEFRASPEWQEVEKQAYPPAEPAKKKKTPKDKGSRYPGAVKANPDGSVDGPGKETVEVGSSAEEAMGRLEVNGVK
ncbi:Tyrosine--tRNA ligase [Endocarpon pusillum Z07020]|uniref:Tyrosine--tRNA ligase n=1 Tax=Endocarpon pusillum (strain Z07020 / HMAS-L-300199) TaxID=1263415 RepID=U1HRR6_ENDPU|nr:Tyrosine--tRNA ligase [Endocarpon pusillum Z07020]ERF71839.1 Tyrosine--tRNA ligase [Endocarpon pusillum Z07020]